jgi:hypothetical protein
MGAEAARTPAEEQVVEAVPELRDHHQDPRRGAVGELELHAEVPGHRGERAGQIVHCGLFGAGEGRAQEQRAADVVVELLVLDDVTALPDQERRDGVHDAGAFRALERQGESHETYSRLASASQAVK